MEDFHRLNDHAVRLHGACDLETLIGYTLDAMTALIACDWPSVQFSPRVGEPLSLWRSPFRRQQEQLEPQYLAYAHQHPLRNELLERADGSAATMGQLVGRDELHALDMYQEVLKPLGIEHQIGLLIPDGMNFAIAAGRSSGPDFSDRDCEMLQLLGPHLALAARNLASRAGGAFEIGGRRVGGEHVTTITLDDHRRIARGAKQYDAVLRRFFSASASRGERLSRQLDHWVRRQQDRRKRQRDRGEPGDRSPLIVERNRRRLTVWLNSVGERHDVQVLLCESLVPATAGTHLLAAGLTPRELQVIRWVAEGKSNPEIGIILGISHRTVKKHLEHIFEKLGVESRTAVVVRALECDGWRLDGET